MIPYDLRVYEEEVKTRTRFIQLTDCVIRAEQMIGGVHSCMACDVTVGILQPSNGCSGDP